MKRDRFQVYLDANPSAKLRDIVSQMLYDTMTGIQWGKIPDEFGWIVKID